MDIVEKQLNRKVPLHFDNGEELIDYMLKNGESKVVLYVSSPRHPQDGELRGIGGNFVEGYFPRKTPYIQASDFRIGICSYLKAEDAEREVNRIKQLIRDYEGGFHD